MPASSHLARRSHAGPIRRVLLAGAACALMAGQVSADRVETTDGAVFTGTVVKDEGERIVVQTAGGRITIARTDLKAVTKEPDAAAAVLPRIIPATVDPADAAAALKQAEAALQSGQWLKAGGLLEGLAALAANALSGQDRRTVAENLTTCHLQIGDAAGAARALTRRAAVTDKADEKRLVLAAAEALRTLKSITIDATEVRTFQKAVPAGARWKGNRLVEEAKALVANSRHLGARGHLERIGKLIVDKLEEADRYTPGAGGQRGEILKPLVESILTGARSAVATLTERREVIVKYKFAPMMAGPIARRWGAQVGAYLALRRQTVDALKSLDPFASKFAAGGLYNSTDVQGLLETLDDLQYYPKKKGAKKDQVDPARQRILPAPPLWRPQK